MVGFRIQEITVSQRENPLLWGSNSRCTGETIGVSVGKEVQGQVDTTAALQPIVWICYHCQKRGTCPNQAAKASWLAS